ncbi:MDR family MFS transporter [Fodinicola acaciae]|uniref:MDR family MFS transporter n=1 Tax=Fodinicola acaciae TaxID=2681555 RepID=UPI001C9E5D21|nr:MDR family MFS transporter [Fodinicola acaciae]
MTEAPKNIRWILLGVLLAAVLSVLDNAIVGTSMPTIVRELGGLDLISWVVTVYLLATAVSTPLWGKAGDLYGRKQVFLTAVAVFLVGSMLTGLSQSMPQLIGFRILQGIGAGGMAASAYALIGALVPPRERGRYQGMVAIFMVVGNVGGPLVGGLVTQYLGWRWAFYLNLPVGLVALVWCQVMLRLPHTRSKARVDWIGTALLSVTITAVVLAATWAGSTYAWMSWQILSLAAVGVLGLALFLFSQTKAEEPVIPLRVFTGSRNFPLAMVMIVTGGAGMFGVSLYVPLFQQAVQGANAAYSGLLLVPLVIPVAVVAQVTGKIMSRTGRYKIFPVVGAVSMAVGLGLLSTMTPATSTWTTAGFLVLVGIGSGALGTMTMVIAQNSVDLRDIGVASSTMALVQIVGGALGVAVFGSIFTRAVQGQVAYQQAVSDGVTRIALVAALSCVVAFVASLFVREVALRGAPAAPAPEKPVPAAR